MLGDISYHKATLKSEGKKVITEYNALATSNFHS